MNIHVPLELSLRDAIAASHRRYVAARPVSAALREAAMAVMPGGNTRTVLSYRPFPTAMAHGEDRRLWDVDGHEYVDFCGEYTAGLFGHSHPVIHAALRAAMANGLSLAAVGKAEADLARLLCERCGYHGSVLTFTAAAPMAVTAPFPFVVQTYNDIAGTVAAIAEHADDLAAVLLEPMIGGGGGIPASVEFLAALRAATTQAKALLIFDEVMTSRMSSGGQQKRVGITPDLTALGKYIGGGMSFGAFGGRADIMEMFAERMPHAGTFNNNVMTMAAGIAAMGAVFTPTVAEALFARGEALRDRLNGVCGAAGVPMQFTGLGSLITAHFRDGLIDAPYMPTAREEGLRELFFFDLLEAGIYNARRIMLALSLPITDGDCDRYVAAVEQFVDRRRHLLQVDTD